MLVVMSPAGEARREARAWHRAQRSASQEEARMRRAEANAERAARAAEDAEMVTRPTLQREEESSEAMVRKGQQVGGADPEIPSGAALKEGMRHGGQTAVRVKDAEGKGSIVVSGDFVGENFVEGAVNVTGPTEHTCQQDHTIGHWTVRSDGFIVPSRRSPMGRMDINAVQGTPWVKPVNPSSIRSPLISWVRVVLVVVGSGGAWERSVHRCASRRHLLERLRAAGESVRAKILLKIPGRDAISALGYVGDELRSVLPRRRSSSWMTGWPSGSADGAVLRAGCTSLTLRSAEVTVRLRGRARRRRRTRARRLGKEAAVPHWLRPRAPCAQFKGEETRLGRATLVPGTRGMPWDSVEARELEGP